MIKHFIALALLALLLISCGSTSEEVWLNKDGSGRYAFQFDMSEILPLLANLPPGATENGKSDGVEKMMMKLLGADRVDTTFNFGEMLPDSISRLMNDPEALRAKMREERGREPSTAELDSMLNIVELLSALKMNFKIDKLDEVLQMSVVSDFGSKQGLAGSTSILKDLQNFSGAAASEGGATSLVDFVMDGKTLAIKVDARRQLERLEKALADNPEVSPLGQSDVYSSLEMMGMSAHRIIVHLPGKITKVSGAPHLLRNENTAVLTLDLISALKQGKDINAMIKFKPKKVYSVTIDK